MINVDEFGLINTLVSISESQVIAYASQLLDPVNDNKERRQTYYNSLILQAVKDIAELKDKLQNGGYITTPIEDRIPANITINDKGDIIASYNTDGNELLVLSINATTGDLTMTTSDNFNADLDHCSLNSQTGEIEISYIV